MIEIEITKRFNDDIFFPMDIYTIDVYLRPEPIKSKDMYSDYESNYLEDYQITKEDWEAMPPREKFLYYYYDEIGDITRDMLKGCYGTILEADETIFSEDEKNEILSKFDNAISMVSLPFDI